MPEHTVSQGETLEHVARSQGVPMRAILDAPENRELFASRRANQLAEGDVLFIPELEPKFSDVGTNAIHTFVLRPRRLRLRVQFLRGGAPRAFEPCRLCVDDGEEIDTQLDEAGWLVTEVNPEAERATLTFFPDTDHAETATLKLGHLDPVTEVRGIQQRLNNLGFDCGEEDADAAERTEAALQAFSIAHQDGPPSSRPDDPNNHELLVNHHNS